MQIGIVGLGGVGKTTLFNLLTQAGADTGFLAGKQQVNVGVAAVPDERVDWLADLYQPRKTTHATIRFTDIPGLPVGEQDRAKLNEFFGGVRDADALVFVVRAFENAAIPPALGSIDPIDEADTLMTELLFADLNRVETVLERLQKQRKRDRDADIQAAALEKCLAVLEEGRGLSQANLSDDETFVLRGYQLLTIKPAILAANVGEESLRGEGHPSLRGLREFATEQDLAYLEFSGAVEEEIAQLGPEERELFMAEYGIQESGIDRLARTAYDRLGLISFFTVGEDEVRAWTIRRNTPAREAAGKIHSDIERGFIKAEVMAYRDLRELGSARAVKEAGKLRLEGKTYIIQDGDIANFRFNV